MKFGKKYEAQMVPEWQEAYMDYNSLKVVLKDIVCLNRKNSNSSSGNLSPNPTRLQGSLNRGVSLYRAFSGFTSRYRTYTRKHDGESIMVSEEQEGSEICYRTVFFWDSDRGGENELVFFRRLDNEFNKIVKFYNKKLEEVIAEADELSKQMNALIALRIKVKNPMAKYGGSDACRTGDSTSFRISYSSSRHGRMRTMDTAGEGEMSEDHEKRISGDVNSSGSKMDSIRHRQAPLHILDHIKINISPETPSSTLKGLFKGPKLPMSFSKEELRKAEQQMIQVFVEFYRKLGVLKNFSFLNQMAFSKILKKYDKITSRNAAKTYLEMVENSCIGKSQEVEKLIRKVETTFVKHFANGDHKIGMNILRPTKRRERHRITYFLGFFSGCSLALAVAVIVLLHARNVYKSEEREKYMENIFPLYSLFGYVVMHMIMYSANIFFWRRYRINFPFIFGFKEGTELGYREVLLVSTGLAVLTLAGVLSNLDMDMDPRTKGYRGITELVPLGLVLAVLFITFCPLNIIHRSSRFFLIKCVYRCICAPLYKVSFPDFFLADQFASQVQAIRSLEFYICYYGWGNYKSRSNNCQASDVYKSFYFVIAVVPYWIRFLQCLRRFLEEKDKMQGINGLRYLMTIIGVVSRTSYDMYKGETWRTVATISSGVVTLGNIYWDLFIDWGLMQRNSENPWLRDKLLVPKRSIYFLAMVLNILLRLAWMQSVLGITETPFLHRKALTALVACLEILRRGIWNFFRLENEHLNNVGKYRAFKTVPLPFDYDYEYDYDELKHA